MMDTSFRLEYELAFRPALPRAYAKLGLFAADRHVAYSADSGTELAHALEDLPTNTHTSAERIANWRHSLREPLERASENPEEFLGEPSGAPYQPNWFNLATGSKY